MEDQSEVVGFLSRPESFPSAPHCVKRIDTHGAHVFLVGSEVYKIKRAVAFEYMDFSTLDKRRRACEAELRINQPHAPQLYLGVVPIARAADERLVLGGSGRVVEWAVHMRRLPQECMLDEIAKRGPLGRDLDTRVAKAVASYHAGARVESASAASGRIRRVVDEVTRFFREEDAGYCQRLAETCTALVTLLDERARNGFVCRGHGDLHLGNIAVVQNEPVLFDALEFDEELATVDVLYDLAFLLMDLDRYGLRGDGCIVLNQYLRAARRDENLDGIAALPLFMSLRAAIRAMVSRQRAAGATQAQAREYRDSAARYLTQARSYLQPFPLIAIAVGGLSGTGKSTLAAELAAGVGRFPGAVHLRSDVERKMMHGVGETVRLPAEAYGAAASAAVYERVMMKMKRALAAGQSVIVDAVFARLSERSAIALAAREAGAEFTGVWLTASPDTLKARVMERVGDASDATAAVVEQQLRYDIGDMDWHVVDAGGAPEATLAAARTILEHTS